VAPSDRIVIFGAGCIGLTILQACLLCGADEITVVDVIPKRLEMAKRFGAAFTLNATEEDVVAACKELTAGMGADIVFEAAGTGATIQTATEIVARGGKTMVVGAVPGETPINFLKINREVSIQTVFRYANRFETAIREIAQGHMDMASMVTHTFGYHDAQWAF